MLKRLALSLVLTLWSVASFAAGTIPLSLTQQFDSTTYRPLSGGKVYFIQAGTTSTPQNAYQDSALTIPYANPYTLSADGRVPQLFFADGNIKIRITNSAGVTQFSQDNLLVIGASSGGGGGGTVDPTTILATGDFKLVYNTGALSGFVRCNGRTIGNASSGATERANADTSALFSFLYTADTNLSVSGGRGASAAADYAANKTIALPDCRSRSLVAMSDMGNSDSGRLSTTYFGCTGLVLGCGGGAESKTLLTANLPAYTPAGSIASSFVGVFALSYAGGSSVTAYVPSASGTGTSSAGTTVTSTFTGTAQGGVSTPVAVASPAILVTTYIKL